MTQQQRRERLYDLLYHHILNLICRDMRFPDE